MQQFLRELRNLLCGNTGFVVHTVTTAAVLPQRAHERELLALAEPFLRKAAAGVVSGGIHTRPAHANRSAGWPNEFDPGVGARQG